MISHFDNYAYVLFILWPFVWVFALISVVTEYEYVIYSKVAPMSDLILETVNFQPNK